MTNIHNHDHGRALSQGNRQADAQFHADGASARGLGIAAMLTGGVMAAEIAGGQLSGSLALLAGAVHMATDFVSLSLAWQGMRLARLPADKRWSYGYGRVTVLAAFANGPA
ncbi:MAG: cobalt-zinc-cadmium efflux system protein, partial [Paracoccaceae bacterium]